MPRRTDIESILVIGAGPIVIGQACEFDYSGTQALRTLKEEGYRTILVNSNPATIMTDPDLADRTYIEPLHLDYVAAIIRREKPQALLSTMGGQTALNLARELSRAGILEDCGVELIGAGIAAIEKAEDREKFKAAMQAAGIETARGTVVRSPREAEDLLLADLGFPAILRPAYTLGGSGGGIAYNREEYSRLVREGLNSSPIGEVLIEESLLGWKEYELEVIRDRADNAIVVCSIENLDPMGVHTGDSITVAPALTLSDPEYQRMRNAALKCVRAIGVETGGSNVQFALDPETGRMLIIEMNPRVSRSSALASKATGYPIAKVATRLAVGYTLEEIPNQITGRTLAAFEPAIDYVVTKIPRFDFEKFPSASGRLGVRMQSVGEVMAIGRTFRESLQKAFRSLEVGLTGCEPRPPRPGAPSLRQARFLDMRTLSQASAFRLLKVRQAFLEGQSVEAVQAATRIDPWFLRQIQQLAQRSAGPVTRNLLPVLKQEGFSDPQIALRWECPEAEVRARRRAAGVQPVYKIVDTCAGEFAASTPYCYSTYDEENEIRPLPGPKIMILGSGPNRIGQGIEFDYCCVQAVLGLRQLQYKTIMVNCNPETVSTDFDLADRLYFEPVTLEDVLNITEFEQPEGVLVQFGGQTPLNIAGALQAAGVPILGTSPEHIDLAEDREKFGGLLDALGISRPEYGTGRSLEEVIAAAERIGYPVLVRPSYILGGRAIEIVYTRDQLVDYIARTAEVTAGHPILVDEFLEDAFEFDVDALGDGSRVHIGAIMQHIEEAGIHSGDSACVIPPYKITSRTLDEILRITRLLTLKLQVRGLINLQFACRNGTVYVLEVNPRASRTVPFVSKATGTPLARIAAQLAVGKTLAEFELPEWDHPRQIAVKESVFPFNRFPGEKVFLGPEMKSTGEVMGIAATLGEAFARATLGTGMAIPRRGTVFISVNDNDKLEVIPIARDFWELGFTIVATQGTARGCRRNGIPAGVVLKAGEGRPSIVDKIKNGEITLIINTPLGQQSRFDEEAIGRAALEQGLPVITTLSGAQALLRAIRTPPQIEVQSLQEYHAGPG